MTDALLLKHPAENVAKGLTAIVEHGSLRKAAKATGIPHTTLHRWSRAVTDASMDDPTLPETAPEEGRPDDPGVGTPEQGDKDIAQENADNVADMVVPVVPEEPAILSRLTDVRYLQAFRRYANVLANGVHPDAADHAARQIDDGWTISTDDHNRMVQALAKMDFSERLAFAADPPQYLDTLYNKWSYNAFDTKDLASQIAGVRQDAYLQAINQQLEAQGRPTVEAITDPSLLSKFSADAQSQAEGIADTYNRDLANQLGSQWLDHRGNDDVYTTRDNIEEQVASWDEARSAWKDDLITQQEGQTAYQDGISDFISNNEGVAETGYVDPPEAVCEECQSWIDEGEDIPWDEIADLFPLHVNCDHIAVPNINIVEGDLWAGQDESIDDSEAVNMSEAEHAAFMLGVHAALRDQPLRMAELLRFEEERDEHGKFVGSGDTSKCAHIHEGMTAKQIGDHLKEVHGKSMASHNKEVLLAAHAKIPEAKAAGAKTYTPKTGGVLSKEKVAQYQAASAAKAAGAGKPTGAGKPAGAAKPAGASKPTVAQAQTYDFAKSYFGMNSADAAKYAGMSAAQQDTYKAGVLGQGMSHADAMQAAVEVGNLEAGKPAGGDKSLTDVLHNPEVGDAIKTTGGGGQTYTVTGIQGDSLKYAMTTQSGSVTEHLSINKESWSQLSPSGFEVAAVGGIPVSGDAKPAGGDKTAAEVFTNPAVGDVLQGKQNGGTYVITSVTSSKVGWDYTSPGGYTQSGSGTKAGWASYASNADSYEVMASGTPGGAGKPSGAGKTSADIISNPEKGDVLTVASGTSFTVTGVTGSTVNYDSSMTGAGHTSIGQWQKMSPDKYAAGGKPTGGDSKPAAPLPTADQLSGFTKVSGPTGSNGGQWYKDPATGKQYLVKPAGSTAIAHNEVAARIVYEALGARPGIDVPNTGVIADPITGNTAVISEKIEGLNGNPTPGVAGGLFGADAITSNWDVVGLQHDNMLADSAGNAVRIDLGGALAYRAQGGSKGEAYSTTAGSWKDYNTLRDSSKNAAAASMFGGMTDAQVADSLDAARLQYIASGGGQALNDKLVAAGIHQNTVDQIVAVTSQRMSEIPAISDGLRNGAANKDKMVGPSYQQAAAAAPLPTNLTAAEKATLKAYTAHYAYAINTTLRGTKGPYGLSVSERTKMAQLDSAFNKAFITGGTKAPMLTFRTVGGGGFPAYRDAKPGDVVGDRAFVSTTRDKSYIANGHQSIAIQIPAGMPAIHVEQISHYKGTAEAEILLQRNANFTREPYDFSISNGVKVPTGQGIPVFTYNGALGLQGAAPKTTA